MRDRWRRMFSNTAVEQFGRRKCQLSGTHCVRKGIGFLAFVVRVGMICVLLTGVVACTHRNAVEQQTQADRNKAAASQVLLSRKYPYANDRMVYIPMENGELEQWTLDGVYQQKIRLLSGDDQHENDRDKDDGNEEEEDRDEGEEDEDDEEDEGDLLWVDNEEIIWSVTKEGKNENEDEDDEYIDYDHVYSTPIEWKDGKEVLLTEQTRELFVYEDSIGSDYAYFSGGLNWRQGVYVDDSYIICNSFYDGILVYDRKQDGKPKQLDTLNTDQYFHFPQCACLTSAISGDHMLCHSGCEDGKIKDDLYGFWSYHLGEQKLQKIDARCFYKAAYVADPVRNKAYYQIVDDQSIWEYDFQTEQCQELITEEQFKACYQQNQLLWDDAYYNDSLYVEGDRIYLVKNRDNPQFFSYDTSKGDLVYEEKLTSLVQSWHYSDGWEPGVDSDHTDHFLLMAEGKLLLCWESSDDDSDLYFLCVDLETAEQKIVTGSDPEKIYFGMNGCWEEPGTTGEWRPSDDLQEINDDQQVSELLQGEPVKIPIADQLNCISQHADLWLQKDYGDDVTQYYAVTDLDHNGRLELIATSGIQGSGAFTFTHYYQVSADGRNLRQITAAIADIDIREGMKTAYVDPETDTHYYLAEDYVSGGAGARYHWYGAVVLDNGMLTSRTYGEIGTDWDEKKTEEVWYGYSYLNGKKETVTEKDFNANKLAAKFFKGFKKKSVNLSWFSVKGKKERTQQKILKKVTSSYRKFAPK